MKYKLNLAIFCLFLISNSYAGEPNIEMAKQVVSSYMNSIHQSIHIEHRSKVYANEEQLKLSKDYFKIKGVNSSDIRISRQGHERFEITNVNLPNVYVKVQRGRDVNNNLWGDLLRFKLIKENDEYRIYPVSLDRESNYVNVDHRVKSLDKNDTFLTSESSRIDRENDQKQTLNKLTNLCLAQIQTCIASCPVNRYSDGSVIGPESSCKSRCNSVSCN